MARLAMRRIKNSKIEGAMMEGNKVGWCFVDWISIAKPVSQTRLHNAYRGWFVMNTNTKLGNKLCRCGIELCMYDVVASMVHATRQDSFGRADAPIKTVRGFHINILEFTIISGFMFVR